MRFLFDTRLHFSPTGQPLKVRARILWKVCPAVLGMWIGGQVLDRIDQAMFKRAILVVLLVAGLNLLRRAVMG